MNLSVKNPKQALNSAYQRQALGEEEIEAFKSNLLTLLSNINPQESEENAKNYLKDFLYDTFYKNEYEINTKNAADLVIHLGKSAKSTNTGVLIEVKHPGNKYQMTKKDDLNFDAMHKLILYYLHERIENNNTDIKHLIITNAYEWFIFDSSVFDKTFYKNTRLNKEYNEWKSGRKSRKDKPFFYEDIAKPFLNELEEEIKFTYFDIRDYEKELKSTDIEENEKLISIYKLLSPTHLLKLPFANDSNSLVPEFYRELLYIIGLEETREGGKRIIQRINEKERNEGAIIENIINKLKSHRVLDVFEDKELEGDNTEQNYFNIALELCITWINRILFLKLLESQLLIYHKNNTEYNFLSSNKIKEFDNLDTLFFEVLAEKEKDRSKAALERYPHVPYLNSSLFEPTSLERKTIRIASLKNNLEIPVYNKTILTNTNEKPVKGNKRTIEYFLDFLNAYDFSTEGKERIKKKEESKTLINASVLGLIFEKINGYKEGSYFTPGFVTEYMCNETIRRSLLDKFSQHYNKDFESFDGLKNFLTRKFEPKELIEANNIANSLKICDPAVGSGHFLVSALNEIIAIKSELGILCDKNGNRLKYYSAKVENDELVIEDREGNLFTYIINDNKPNLEDQRIQETIFHEKEKIIENCLFGVDINPNSVKICRLRLWIELLKNAYYTAESNFKELETLPNIDINIKRGNSLISNFEKNLPPMEKEIVGRLLKKYKIAFSAYQQTSDNKSKNHIIKQLKNLKTELEKFAIPSDPEYKKLKQKENELAKIIDKFKSQPEVVAKYTKEYYELESEYHKKHEPVYRHAFDWGLEFPEILNDDGVFIGFDIVIGNPPYIKEYENKKAFDGIRKLPCYQGKMDIWYLFASRGVELLKENGYLCFIAINNWVTNTGASKFRNFIINNTQILQLSDFGSYMVFDAASVQTMIMLFRNNKTIDNYTFDYRHVESTNPTKEEAIALLNKKEGDNLTYLTPKIIKENNINKSLHFTDKNIEKLLNKIASHANFKLDEKKEVAQGIVPNPDVVNSSNISKIPFEIIEKERITVGDGVFVIPKNYLRNLPKQEKKYIKPIFEPHLIDKYYLKINDKEIIYITKNNYKDDAPQIISHLKKFKPIMEDRRENKNGRLEYYHLHWPRDEFFFAKGPKILSVRKCDNPTFLYLEDEAYVMMAVNVIRSPRINLKYLSGLLNSKLIAFWLKHRGKMQGNNYQIDKEPILNLPIIKPSENETNKIALLVDKILKIKQQNPDSDTSSLENEIDELVYGLYGLSEEEREVIKAK